MMTFVEMAQMLYNEMYEVGPHDRIDEWDCMGMYEVMMKAAESLDKAASCQKKPANPSVKSDDSDENG